MGGEGRIARDPEPRELRPPVCVRSCHTASVRRLWDHCDLVPWSRNGAKGELWGS